MTFLVGFGPHNEDYSSLDLACQLARSSSESVHVVSVVPRGWPTPVAGDTDREFERWAATEGEAAAARVDEHLGRHRDVSGEATWVAGRSVPQALADRAQSLGASIIVVGSGEDVGPGRIGISSKTDRLLHSSDVPIAIAPRGYLAGPGAVVDRITLAFRGDDATWTLLERVAEIAHRISASLRVVTFAVRAPTMYPPLVSGAEDMVLAAWVEQARVEQAAAVGHLCELGFTDATCNAEVAVGRSWGDAMNSLGWRGGDLLVVGSSSTRVLAHVFLGSSAAKIVRHSPVPVIVVP